MNREEQVSFLLALVDSALDAILVHRLDGSIVWYNRGALELLGCDDDHMQALPPFGWVAADLQPDAPDRRRVLASDGQMTFASAVDRCDGVRMPTQVSVKLVETSLGPMVITVIRDDSERVAAREALERRARHDPLTELMNRVCFDETLAAAVERARTRGEVFALAYIDLDDFKLINDCFGHTVGDAVLTQIARRLRGAVRPEDSVARLGGDEFAVILPNMPTEPELVPVVKRLVEAIEAPISIDGVRMSVVASIGLAHFDPTADTCDSLVLRADRAMYQAKDGEQVRWKIDSSSSAKAKATR